ncbi:MAG: hypothetical protein SGBAC_010214 [Bacillariaceae sp.]
MGINEASLENHKTEPGAFRIDGSSLTTRDRSVTRLPPQEAFPRSPLEMEEAVAVAHAIRIEEADGVLREEQNSRMVYKNHRKETLLLIMLIVALFAFAVTTFQKEEILPFEAAAAPGDLNDGSGPSNYDPSNDEDDINKVDLAAENPKLDGVQFISPACNYTCRTDRLPLESPLYPGQALCNEAHRFGMTDDGDLFLQDCQLHTTATFWSAAQNDVPENQFPIHFELQRNGYIQVLSDPTNHVLFEAQPKTEITFHRLCLARPKLHCPYLHLHPDGVLVLNWIDDTNNGEWKVDNVLNVYPELKKSN